MTDVVKITGVAPDNTIYGTYALAIAYIGAMYGDTYTAWLALGAGVNNVAGPGDDQKRTLVAATRFIDAITWEDAVNTQALRDAIAAFPQAVYELAVMILDDPSVIAVLDTGSNLKMAGAGGANVEFFNPTSAQAGTAQMLPPILQRLIGQYLGASDLDGIGVGSSQAGECGEILRRDDFKRWNPL